MYDITTNKRKKIRDDNQRDFTIDSGSIRLTVPMVEKYSRIVKDNNFKYLYDKTEGKYFFQRIEPIYQGTIIVDMMLNRVITLEKEFRQEELGHARSLHRETQKMTRELKEKLQKQYQEKLAQASSEPT